MTKAASGRDPGALLVAIGLLLLAAPLIFAVQFPSAYLLAEFYLRVVAALGAAIIGSRIPGWLHVTLPFARAGGALAIFVLVMFVNPSGKVFETSQPSDQEEATVPQAVPGDTPPLTEDPTSAPQAAVAAKLDACVAEKVLAYETPKEMQSVGGARAAGPGFNGHRRTASEDVCVAVGPTQEIISARTEEVSCHGGRCSVTAPVITDDRKKVCVRASAWSESRRFGGGGSGQYRLIVEYKDLATPGVLESFRASCKVNIQE